MSQRALKGKELLLLPEGWLLYEEYMFTVGKNIKLKKIKELVSHITWN